MSAAFDVTRGPLVLAFTDDRADANGAPILFVHGFGHNRSVWQGTVELLDGAFEHHGIQCAQPRVVQRFVSADPAAPDCHHPDSGVVETQFAQTATDRRCMFSDTEGLQAGPGTGPPDI